MGTQTAQDEWFVELLRQPLAEFHDQFAGYVARIDPASTSDGGDRDLAPRVADSVKLQARLFADGWGRCGWPLRAGGLGGTIRHRAVVAEVLADVGWPGPMLFEHLEILGPALCAFADQDFLGEVMPQFLNGSQPWAQGFSEPDAGSDLASLRSAGRATSDGLVVTGRKIWTSWATYASRCLVLVRTDPLAPARMAMTAVALDLRAEGVQVRPIIQADGTDGLAELVFDDVAVPERAIIGGVGNGWAVALHILERERGIYSWFRQLLVRQSVTTELSGLGAQADALLGDVILDLAALRSVSRDMVEREANGASLGAGTAVNKCLSTVAEQQAFELIRKTAGPSIGLGAIDPARTARIQRDYLFSGIVSIYGGSREMQMDTIATRVLRLPR